MSNHLISSANNSAILATALSNINTHSSYSPYSTSIGDINSGLFNAKLIPSFKLEMYKAENGGFILNLIKQNQNDLTPKNKLFILKEIENLGKDLQNILATEVLKDC